MPPPFPERLALALMPVPLLPPEMVTPSKVTFFALLIFIDEKLTWEAAAAAGQYRISTRGRTLQEEGFIHACFADQVDGVARRYYADVREPMVVLAVDVCLVGCEVRLEVPPGAADAFPHLYGPIPVGAVVAVTPYSVVSTEAAWARLHHAHLFCADVDATVAWWRRWFGARVVADEVLLGSRNVMVAIGDGRLNLYDQPPPTPSSVDRT